MNRFLKPMLSRAQAIVALCVATLLLVPTLKADDLQSRIDQYLKDKVATKQFSGEVLVARGDAVLIRGDYGLAGRKHGALSNNRKFRFPVGAVAEQFVAVAVLQLEDQGKIKINASICDYVPNCPSDWKDIQVVHLLTHTSGLPAFKRSSPDQKNSDTLHKLLAAAGRQYLEFQPGSKFKYNELDFILLGLAIESVLGRPASEFIETAVSHMLKMTDTKYLQNSCGRPEPGLALSDDQVCSTVEDLYRFDRALAKGAIISNASQLQMFTPYRDGHGLGWKINKEFGKRLALQTGQSDGASVSVRLYPDDDVYIILVADANDIDSAELTHDIGAILFGKSYPASGEATSASPVEK